MWEQLNPCPPGPVEDFTKDERFKKAKIGLGTHGHVYY